MKPLVSNCKGCDILNTEKKLEHFMDISTSTATKTHDDIVEKYQAQLDEIFNDHKTEALRKAALTEKSSLDTLQRTFRKELSHEQIKVRQNISLERSQRKNQLFGEVLELLEAYKQTAAYKELLIRQIQTALSVGRDATDMTIYLDPEDAPLQAELELKTGGTLTLSSYSFMGGTRAVIPSKNILIDESFQSKLDDAKEHFHFDFKL
jgi:vacuolar-type H+-ATPase subunit E/Vma4